MRLDRLKLRHLRTLVAVADKGNLIRAAEEMSVTQPAVTKALTELEGIIGQKLMERSRRGVVLTPAGKILLHFGGASLRTLREGLDSLEKARTADAPLLAIGALATVGTTVLPSALQRFAEALPQVRLRVRTGSNTQLLTGLRHGELDVVVGRLAEPVEMQGLTFEQLYTEVLVFVVKTDHPLAIRPRLTPDALLEYPLMLADAGTRPRTKADQFFLASGLGLSDPVVEAIDAAFCRAYVLRSDVIWFAPLGIVEHDLRQGALVRLHIDTDGTSGPVGVTVRADRGPSEHLRLLLEALRKAADEWREGDLGLRRDK